MLVRELFHAVGLEPRGQPWGMPVPEPRPGVYVLALSSGDVVYVGRASRSLARHLGHFYQRNYRAEHPDQARDGRKPDPLLEEPLYVHWALTPDPRRVSREMLKAFNAKEHCLPYANQGTRAGKFST
jgi:hypothetical protein